MAPPSMEYFSYIYRGLRPVTREQNVFQYRNLGSQGKSPYVHGQKLQLELFSIDFSHLIHFSPLQLQLHVVFPFIKP